MRQSEKLLLAGTVGLGLILAVTQLPGKGRQRTALPGPALRPPADDGNTKALPPPATIELLAAHRVKFKPIAPAMRNPFRPAQEETETATAHVAVAIKVTAFFGEGGELAALVKGEMVQAGRNTGDLTIVHVMVRECFLDALLRDKLSKLDFTTPEEARLLALLRGRLVRTGDAVGGLTVVGLAPGHVDLERNGKQYRLKFPKRPTEPDEAGEHRPASEPRRTESANY